MCRVGGEGRDLEVEVEVVSLRGGVGGECVELITTLVLQVGVEDQWVWKLHSSNHYTVSSVAYHMLIEEAGLEFYDNNSIAKIYLSWLK